MALDPANPRRLCSFFPTWDALCAGLAHAAGTGRPEKLCVGSLPRFADHVKLRHAATCALLTMLAAGCAQLGPPAAVAPDDPAGRAVSLDSFDQALLGRVMFAETNRVRVANGVSRLAHSAALDAAADEQASWTALTFHAGHANPIPGEHTAADRVAHAGLDGLRVGENAIMIPARRPAGSPQPDYTYGDLAAVLVDDWLNSPAHRANLLDPRYTLLGCAARVAHGVLPGDQRVFATQVFFQAYPKDPGK
jgi:uncharacterized protein YkwD